MPLPAQAPQLTLTLTLTPPCAPNQHFRDFYVL